MHIFFCIFRDYKNWKEVFTGRFPLTGSLIEIQLIWVDQCHFWAKTFRKKGEVGHTCNTVLGKLKQEESYESEDNLGYTVSSRPV